MSQDEYRLEDLMDIPEKITLEYLTKLVCTVILERREQNAEFAKQRAERNTELDKYIAECAKQRAELDKQRAERNAELDKYIAECAKQRAEFDKQSAERNTELDKYIAECAKQRAEFDKQSAERNAELDKYIAECAKQRAEQNVDVDKYKADVDKYNADAAKYKAEFDKAHAEFVKGMAELKESSRRTDAQIKRTGKQLGDLHNKFGRMEEIHMLPSVTKLLNQNGYDFRERATYRNYILEDDDNKTLTEVDAVIDNCATTALLEVKTSLVKVKDIEQHIRRMQLFRADYERRGIPVKELIGVVAGVEFADDAKQAAIEAGFFVVVPDGKRIKFDVPEGFKAKLY